MRALALAVMLVPGLAIAQTGGATLGTPTAIERIEIDQAKQNLRLEELSLRLGKLEDRVTYFEDRILKFIEQEQDRQAAKPPRQRRRVEARDTHRHRSEKPRRKITKGDY